MASRDCATCAHDTRRGCTTWSCEYINRADAIAAWKKAQNPEETKTEKTEVKK